MGQSPHSRPRIPPLIPYSSYSPLVDRRLFGRLRCNLCQHAIDRCDNHIGIVDLDKVPGIGNDLVVTARGERSVGAMSRRECPEKQRRLLTHIGGHMRRHGVTSGGQYDQG